MATSGVKKSKVNIDYKGYVITDTLHKGVFNQFTTTRPIYVKQYTAKGSKTFLLKLCLHAPMNDDKALKDAVQRAKDYCDKKLSV